MSASDALSRTITIRRTDSVRSAPRVRHVDELSEEALERFVESCRDGAASTSIDGASFVDGEVIVFTDYYRVELV